MRCAGAAGPAAWDRRRAGTACACCARYATSWSPASSSSCSWIMLYQKHQARRVEARGGRPPLLAGRRDVRTIMFGRAYGFFLTVNPSRPTIRHPAVETRPISRTGGTAPTGSDKRR